jgi:hypothetical protein
VNGHIVSGADEARLNQLMQQAAIDARTRTAQR